MLIILDGTWSHKTGHNAPLHAQSHERSLSVSDSITHFVHAGVPAHKLIMGIPLYGRSFTLKNAGNNGVGAPIYGAGNAGPITRTRGSLAYYEVCMNLKKGKWTRVWDSRSQVPYCHHGNQWVSYDDVQSVTLKAQYAVQRGLGGTMVWSIETDDFHGVCDGQRNPLMHAISNVVRSNES